MSSMKRSLDYAFGEDNDASMSIDMRRTTLVDYAQNLVVPLVPDAIVTHDVLGPLGTVQRRGVIRVKTQQYGTFTCCYDEPTYSVTPDLHTDNPLWRYAADCIFREAHRLDILTSPYKPLAAIEQSTGLVCLDLMRSVAKQDKRIVKLEGLVDVLMGMLTQVRKNVQEVSDNVNVCSERLNIMQFGDTIADDSTGIHDTASVLPVVLSEAPLSPITLQRLLADDDDKDAFDSFEEM